MSNKQQNSFGFQFMCAVSFSFLPIWKLLGWIWGGDAWRQVPVKTREAEIRPEKKMSPHCSLPIEIFAMINNFQCTHSHRWSQVQRCQCGIREKWLKRKSPPLKIDRKTKLHVAGPYASAHLLCNRLQRKRSWTWILRILALTLDTLFGFHDKI